MSLFPLLLFLFSNNLKNACFDWIYYDLGVGNVFKITLQSIMAWVGHNCMITLNIKERVEVLFY